MELYLNIKSKYLRKRLIEQDKIQKEKNRKEFEKSLPRKGSLLRQLVDIELSK